MKDLRIFVASSKELERERNELAILVLAKEEVFAERGLWVGLAKWEYVDPRLTEARTEMDKALVRQFALAGWGDFGEDGGRLAERSPRVRRVKFRKPFQEIRPLCGKNRHHRG